MGERFYLAQLQATGSCPGANPNSKNRRRKLAWTDEKKQEAVSLYEDASPTPQNSMEIVKEIAEQLEETPNGVRMILMKAGVYVKKEATSGSGSGGAEKKASSTRVSKEDAQNGLKAAIEAAGQKVDPDIISKLTGKAAVYFTEVLNGVKEG